MRLIISKYLLLLSLPPHFRKQGTSAGAVFRSACVRPQGEKVGAGCIAGFVSCLAVYPLDMLRTCASMSGAPKGFVPLIRTVMGISGPRGFYQVCIGFEWSS